MATRDDELDRLEEELSNAESAPFVHRPDTMDLRDGMLCWLDGSRVCGPDCMAYNTEETDEDGNLLQGPNRCLPLLYIGQQGAAALVTIAVSRRKIVEAQDRQRQEQVPPPNPFPKR